MDAIRLDHRPQFGDAFHGILFGFWGTPGRVAKSLMLAVAFGALLSTGIAFGTRLPWGIALAIAVVGALLWMSLFTIALGAWVANRTVRLQRAKGDARIAVTDESLERNWGDETLKVNWSGVSSVHETSRAFFMFDGKRPVFAIEKSACPSAAGVSSLRRFLRAKKPGTYFEDDRA